MKNKELLGLRIKELRRRKGINQEQLAEIIDVDPTTISNIENGKNYPSLSNLEKLLQALDSNFLEVFDFNHKMPPNSLLEEINLKLKSRPDKIEDFYKIVSALIK